MIKAYDKIRNPIKLNGKWLLCEDKTENGQCLFDSTVYWREVDVPSDIASCFPERPYNTGVFYYKRTFIIENDTAERTVLLFDAVNYLAHIYVNGKYAGMNDQGFLPFDFDISDFIVCGENELVVRVDTRRSQGQLPTSFYWKNYSGITRDVCIYQTRSSYIDKLHIEAHANGSIALNIKTVLPENLSIKATIKDTENNIIFETRTQAREELVISAKTEDVKLWSVNSPTLYKAELELYKNGEIIDKKSDTFGYRDIEVKDGKICLNSEPIFLKGFNRHEDHPKSGGAACEEVVKTDFEMIKKSGANFIRMCHYPHDERELYEADRLGLLLLVEIPLCAYMTDSFEIENTEHKPKNDEVYSNAKDYLSRMIDRDFNHPSVIIWSVSNENNEPEYKEVIENHKALIQLAKKLDPTRLATHVSMHSRKPDKDKFFVYDDIICINTYPTLLGRYSKRDENYDFSKSEELMKETIEGLKSCYPGKPVVVSEFGYRTRIAFDSIHDEEIQAEAVKAEYLAVKKYGEGASVWIFADHLWPCDPVLPGKISRYGLLNRDRTKKEVYDVYCELLKQE